MATRAATQIQTSQVTSTPDGFCLEIWRCQGGTVGDTTAITPARGRFVKRVNGPVGSSLSTVGTDTSVTLTHMGTLSTSGTFDVEIISQP
jgi:hypothetical protein